MCQSNIGLHCADIQLIVIAGIEVWIKSPSEGS